MATEAANVSTTKNLSQWAAPIRGLVFGKQNERIEYIMDSYFKLPPEGRSAAILGGIVMSILMLMAIIATYIAALGSLQSKLDEAFEATNKLREAHTGHILVKQKFSELERKLEASTQGLVMISVLETKAKELGLTTSGFPPQLPTSDLGAGNPLAEKYQNAKVEFRVNNASLKKIMDYVIAVESTQHLLKVSSLKIKALYQNKLFFDATVEVEGIVAKK
jgi:hypothetical protein